MARGPYPAILRIARATEKFFGVPVNGEHVIYPAIIRIAQAIESTNIEDIDAKLESMGVSIITAAENTLVNGKNVPGLTSAQVATIYGTHAAKKAVVVKDAANKYYHIMSVDQVTQTVEEVETTSTIVYLLFEDSMLLTYTATGENVVITYKEFEATEPVIIQAETHEDFDGYFIPSLTVEQVQSAFDNFSAGKPVLINDSLDFTKTSILEVSAIAGTAIRILFGGVLLLTYTISTETEPSSVVVTGGKLAFEA